MKKYTVPPLSRNRLTDLVVHLDAGDGDVFDGVGDVDQRRARHRVVDVVSVVFVGIRREHDVGVPRTPGPVALDTLRKPADHQQRPHDQQHLQQSNDGSRHVQIRCSDTNPDPS